MQFQWLCLSQFLKTYGIDPNVSKAGDLRSALFVWVLVIRTLHVTTDYSACEALLESRKAPESKEPTLFSILVEYIRAGDIGQLLREMHVLVQSARLADVEISLLVDALTSLLKERFRGRSFYFPLLIHTTRMLCHLPKHVHHVPYLVNSLVLSGKGRRATSNAVERKSQKKKDGDPTPWGLSPSQSLSSVVSIVSLFAGFSVFLFRNPPFFSSPPQNGRNRT